MQSSTHSFGRKRTTGSGSSQATTIAHPLPQPAAIRPAFLADQSVETFRIGLNSGDKRRGAGSPMSSASPPPPYSPRQPLSYQKPITSDSKPLRMKSSLSPVTLSEEATPKDDGRKRAATHMANNTTRSEAANRCGMKPGVISPEQADIICPTPEEVVELLNGVFSHTNLVVKQPIYPPLRSVIDAFIFENMEFGHIYARLRHHWPISGDSFLSQHREFSLEKQLSDGFSFVEQIKETERPFQIWDLYANRVVPSRFLFQLNDKHPFWAVSHTRTEDTQDFYTPINNCERPVPIPNGVSLEAVRDELLALGAEYAWLDVLCSSGRKMMPHSSRENYQRGDWDADDDTPSIGEIFENYAKEIVRYKNGLGRRCEHIINPNSLRRSTSGMQIPLQITRAHQRKLELDIFILAPERADFPCSSPDEIIEDMNNIFATSFGTLDGFMQIFLASLVQEQQDFGTVYARLRPWWPDPSQTYTRKKDRNDPVAQITDGIRAALLHGKSDAQRRNTSIGHKSINEYKSITPRRLWDLYANRVVPYDFSYSTRRNPLILAVSHSWTDEMHRPEGRLSTSVNNHEWPVPFPRDVTLEALRTELLNMGAQYAWVDVLCIRQISSDPAKESRRKNEWKVDLPTIGAIFDHHAHRVVRYMNGLGRAFEPFGWDTDRHWLNRAWTLQETRADSIIGGVPDGISDPRDVMNVFTCERFKDRLETISRFESVRSGTFVRDFTVIIDAMRRRKSSNPTDKVFGVAMMLCQERLPLYREQMSMETAWSICIEHLSSSLLGVFLFKSPIPGTGSVEWRPSWSQLLANEASELRNTYPFVFVTHLALSVLPDGKACYLGPVVKGRFTPNIRTKQSAGKITIQRDYAQEVYDVNLILNRSLPENDYFFVGEGYELTWLVCLKTRQGLFRKVAVATTMYGRRLGNFVKNYEYCVFV